MNNQPNIQPLSEEQVKVLERIYGGEVINPSIEVTRINSLIATIRAKEEELEQRIALWKDANQEYKSVVEQLTTSQAKVKELEEVLAHTIKGTNVSVETLGRQILELEKELNEQRTRAEKAELERGIAEHNAFELHIERDTLRKQLEEAKETIKRNTSDSRW